MRRPSKPLFLQPCDHSAEKNQPVYITAVSASWHITSGPSAYNGFFKCVAMFSWLVVIWNVKLLALTTTAKVTIFGKYLFNNITVCKWKRWWNTRSHNKCGLPNHWWLQFFHFPWWYMVWGLLLMRKAPPIQPRAAQMWMAGWETEHKEEREGGQKRKFWIEESTIFCRSDVIKSLSSLLTEEALQIWLQYGERLKIWICIFQCSVVTGCQGTWKGLISLGPSFLFFLFSVLNCRAPIQAPCVFIKCLLISDISIAVKSFLPFSLCTLNFNHCLHLFFPRPKLAIMWYYQELNMTSVRLWLPVILPVRGSTVSI